MDITGRIKTRIDDSHAPPGASSLNVLIKELNKTPFFKKKTD